ncbi:MAG TPA: amidohydrolase family protein [Gemmatimonadales bacterium]|nr:amidohydrolase family protein [Gemmatimonadales bacterium]
MRQLLFLAVSLGAASAAAGQTGAASLDTAVFAFTGVTLIDGTTGPARPGTTILVTGDRIIDVFPDGTRPVPPGAHTPDVRGRYVIPGLIDTHVHLATDPSNEDSLALTERKLKSALLGGITTVRDMAGDARQLGFLARAAAVRDIASPSIYYAALFAGPDFFTDPRVRATSAGVPLGKAPWARSVTAATDWRQVIAEARGTGATAIKLYADFTAEVLPPLVAEAHRQGLKTWAHAALFPAKPSDVVTAGVDVISHAGLLGLEVDTVRSDFRQRSRLDYSKLPLDAPALDRLLHSMAERGTIFEPTLYVYFVRDSNSSALRWAAGITRRANQAGVAISAGTDMMVGNEADILDSPPHLQEELSLLVNRAGLTPSQALIAATSTAARAIGVDSLVGTVTPGKLADLVVLTADPLVDIGNTRKIEMVVARGVIYRPDR